MQCPHCHADDQEGRFCKRCGKPLSDEASDLTRVMPPLEGFRSEEAEDAAPLQAEAAEDTAPEAAETPAPEDVIEEEPAEETDEGPAVPEGKPLPAFLTDEDDEEAVDALLAEEDERRESLRRKVLTAVALFIGIGLAAVAAVYLFTGFFDTTPQTDPSEQVKNADTIAPDTSLAEDTIVGHWRHYNTGSVIEKIGSGRYRWTIEDDVYQLDFEENQYVYEDENGNVYSFVLTSADRLQLAASSDASGGLISNPVFESGYVAGRVGQDGTMAKSMTVNADAFSIVGKTYAQLAGTYGPGSLSVIGDNQYIIFRAEGGNFAVQFEGETVPLKADSGQGYTLVPLSAEHTTPSTDATTDPGNNGSGETTTGDGTTNNGTTGGSTTTDDDEPTEYTVEIPDMPTFPSTSAVATGVVWADLGFVINNCPDTISVEDLSAVLGIALEVGTSPGNESGFSFFGSDEGYFAGTYALGDHSFYISGYGNSTLVPDKTIIFIQQIS